MSKATHEILITKMQMEGLSYSLCSPVVYLICSSVLTVFMSDFSKDKYRSDLNCS